MATTFCTFTEGANCREYQRPGSHWQPEREDSEHQCGAESDGKPGSSQTQRQKQKLLQMCPDRPVRACRWRIGPHAVVGVSYKPRQCFCHVTFEITGLDSAVGIGV